MISQYVKNVLDKFSDIKETSNGWLTYCPNPLHGNDGIDSSPSLRITIGQEGKILITCRVGCSLHSILNSICLNSQDLFCPPGEIPAEPLILSTILSISSQLENKIYSYLLNSLTLSNEHRKQLQQRGLSDKQIDYRGYKSLLSNELGKKGCQLYEEFGVSVFQVPGFTPTKYGAKVGPSAGMLIPVRNSSGEILAIKIRRDTSPKYLYLSNGKGPSSGSPVHFPKCSLEQSFLCVRVTEGELKADIATALSNTYTIGIPGVNNWSKIKEALSHLDPEFVLISFDWPDVCSNKSVRDCLISSLSDNTHYKLGIETWDNKYKGIDDALAAKSIVTEVWGSDISTALSSIDSPVSEKCMLISDNTKIEDFPIEVFPSTLREYISKVSSSLQLPSDFLGVSCLTVLGRAIGTARRVNLYGSWTEGANLYTVIVSPPGKLKTSALNYAIKPLNYLQNLRSKEYQEVKKTWDDWKEACKVAKLSEDSSPIKPDVGLKPLEKILIGDFTCEALIARLYNNLFADRHDSSVLIFRDEISAWVKSMNMYRSGRGADRDFFLSAWSCQPHDVDRKFNNESIRITHPCVSVLGSIQPDRLLELDDKGGREDGFFHRNLFCFPSISKAFRPALSAVEDEKVPEHLEVMWQNCISTIYNLILPSENFDQPYTLITPTPEAAILVRRYLNEFADEEEDPKLSRDLIAPWAKFRAYFARFALILHYAKWFSSSIENTHAQEGQINEDTIHAAAKLVRYFKSHYQKVSFYLRAGPVERQIEDFVMWTSKHGGKCSPRDIYRYRRFGTTCQKDTIKLMELAQDREYGILTEELDSKQRKRKIFLLKEII